MANVRALRKAEAVRNSLTQDMLKRVRYLYAESYAEVSKQIEASSDRMTKVRLQVIRKQIVRSFESINSQIEKEIITAMRDISIAEVEAKRVMLSSYGFKSEDVERAFFYVPERVVTTIATGRIYNEGWSLSSSIWGHNQKNIDDIGYIISKGVAQGSDSYTIAKNLQKYVNPKMAKKNRKIVFYEYKRDSFGRLLRDENGNYIKSGKQKTFYFGDVDYNASRLARTMISHAYQQSFETVNAKDPFVTKYIWHSAGQHGRTCQICLDRDGKLFDKDDLPLDHPNGMCTFEAYIPYDDKWITDRLIAWYHADKGTYPEIDEYAKTFLEG